MLCYYLIILVITILERIINLNRRTPIKHIFFHNDIDGVFASALFAERTGTFKDMQYVLHSVSTAMRGEKLRAMIDKIKDEPFFIFDFQYHEKAGLWIDHHQSEQIGREPILNESICYDGGARSATNLVGKYLQSLSVQLSPECESMIRAADMIDSADYPTVEFIFRDKSPAMIMRAFFEFSYPTEMMFCRSIETLVACGLNIEKTNKVLNIDSSYVEAIEHQALKTKDKIEVYNKFSVIRQKYSYQYPRYSEHYSVNTKYNVRVSEESKTEHRVSISYNRWSKEKSNFNIGAFCVANKLIKKGGGGHYNIGGGVIDKTKLDEFLDQLSETLGG